MSATLSGSVRSFYKYRWQQMAQQANSSGLKLFLPFISGSDGRPQGQQNYGSSTATTFEQHIREGMSLFNSYGSSASPKRMVMCCWNEWGEGAFIEPALIGPYYSHQGSELADAHRRTVKYGATPFTNSAPTGVVYGSSAEGVVTGWAVDPDTPSRKITVDVYADGPYGSGTFLAHLWTQEPDGNANAAGYFGSHGFFFYVPAEWRGHTLYFYAIDSSGKSVSNTMFGTTTWW